MTSQNFPGAEEIHQKRCDADPIYHLHHFPERDEFDATFLEKSITLIQKKYGAIDEDDLIHHVFGLLRRYDDHEARFVAITCMIAWEQEISDTVKDSLDPAEAIHGSMTTQHYRKYRAWLRSIVGQLIQRPFNKNNVIQDLSLFREACINEHWLGSNLPRN